MEPRPSRSNSFLGVLLFFGGFMLDLKRIRTDFDAVAEKLATRGVAADVSNDVICW